MKLFSNEELEDVGLEIVENPVVVIEGISYMCCSRKICNITKLSEWDEEFHKPMILSIVLDSGFTHVLSIEKLDTNWCFNIKNNPLFDSLQTLMTFFQMMDGRFNVGGIE